MATITGIGSIPELAFLTQLFVIGSAIGMLVALMRHRRTGEADERQILVARWALLFTVAGVSLLLSSSSTP